MMRSSVVVSERMQTMRTDANYADMIRYDIDKIWYDKRREVWREANQHRVAFMLRLEFVLYCIFLANSLIVSDLSFSFNPTRYSLISPLSALGLSGLVVM